MESTQKKVVVDFIKAFSCAYSVTKNLGLELEVETDPLLLRSVVGFSSGISTMGDTCGVANGGVTVLGKKYPDLPADRLYLLCAEYFRRLERRVGSRMGVGKARAAVVHHGRGHGEDKLPLTTTATTNSTIATTPAVAMDSPIAGGGGGDGSCGIMYGGGE